MRGWFKGIVASQLTEEKGYGFIKNAELETLFGKDTYVHKGLLEGVPPGTWVSFNSSLQRDRSTGQWNPICTHMQICEETWKPTPADLSETRAVESGKGA